MFLVKLYSTSSFSKKKKVKAILVTEYTYDIFILSHSKLHPKFLIEAKISTIILGITFNVYVKFNNNDLTDLLNLESLPDFKINHTQEIQLLFFFLKTRLIEKTIKIRHDQLLHPMK